MREQRKLAGYKNAEADKAHERYEKRVGRKVERRLRIGKRAVQIVVSRLAVYCQRLSCSFSARNTKNEMVGFWVFGINSELMLPFKVDDKPPS